MSKAYLGDSVYAMFDGYAITLTTENGLPTDPSNTIYLEPEVYRKLTEFVAGLSKHRHDAQAAQGGERDI